MKHPYLIYSAVSRCRKQMLLRKHLTQENTMFEALVKQEPEATSALQ